MLAVKSALAEQDTVPLLVFDEIDANVGGEIAHAVGEKMRALGEGRQVLCISHLPQVASKAAQQFVVSKDFVDGRTISKLELVEGPSREQEIARMLGGKSASALELARSLLSPQPGPGVPILAEMNPDPASPKNVAKASKKPVPAKRH
jgi:DNA repair protein RecN (Recombination protein N)